MGLFAALFAIPIDDTSMINPMRVYASAAEWDYTEFDLRPDVQAVMEAIAERSFKAVDGVIDREPIIRADFRGAVLQELLLEDSELALLSFSKVDFSRSSFSYTRFNRVDFIDANLSPSRFVGSLLQNVSLENCAMSNADFRGSEFSDSIGWSGFNQCDLTGANFSGANLTGIRFLRTELRDTDFDEANLTGVRFSVNGRYPARNLTQSQIDVARADPNNPPTFDGLIDPNSGKQLVWRG